MATTTTTTTTEPIETSLNSLKLDVNPLETEKTQLIQDLAKKIESQQYDDWRQDLLDNGFVVVKNVIPKEKALQYQQEGFNWLKRINEKFDEKDPSTWTRENLPDTTKIGAFFKYGVSHEKFVWDARLEKGYRDVFAKFWGTDELLVSFDAINISLPGVKGLDLNQKPWPHVDQSPYRNGLTCIQGIAQFSNSGAKDGSLLVYKKSHKLAEEFFEKVLKKENWSSKDLVLLKEEDLDWFVERGSERIKVEAEPGDLILWDSRTIHYGEQPDPEEGVIRSINYISYAPASFATKESLEKKKEAFDTWSGTTHWAFDNINPRYVKALLPNGELDPKDIGEPLDKPEVTDDILRLAGIKSY